MIRRKSRASDAPAAPATSVEPAAAAGVEAAPAEREALLAEVARLRAREDELLRGLAELTNASRRRKQDMDAALQFAEEGMVRSLLPVIDDFDRALAAISGPPEDPIRSGVQLVRDRLWKILEQHGLEAVPAQGGAFDPELHDALMQRPTPEHPPDHVLEVVRPGYRFRGRVLRPAQVVVSGGAPPEGPPE